MGEVVGWGERAPKALCDTVVLGEWPLRSIFKTTFKILKGVLTYSLGYREETNA